MREANEKYYANEEYYKNKEHDLTVLPQSSTNEPSTNEPSTNEPSTNESPVTQDGPSADCIQCVKEQKTYYKDYKMKMPKNVLCRLFCMHSGKCSEENCDNYGKV